MQEKIEEINLSIRFNKLHIESIGNILILQEYLKVEKPVCGYHTMEKVYLLAFSDMIFRLHRDGFTEIIDDVEFHVDYLASIDYEEVEDEGFFERLPGDLKDSMEEMTEMLIDRLSNLLPEKDGE